MKTLIKLHVLCFALLGAAMVSHAQSTAFTYNGRLNNNGVPANGAYDLRFTIYDASADGNVIAGPLPFESVDVANGLFTVRIDFGADVFTGPPRWLSVEVQPTGGGGAFALLTPRQEVTSSPYSIQAQTAGSVADSSVVANQLNTGGVAPTPGQFLSYNGGNLFWSDPGIAAGGIWSLSGNNAFYNAGNVGIGIMNPLEKLTIAGVTSFNTGLKLTGNASGGTGLAIENTSVGGHKFDLISGAAGDGIGVGAFGLFDETIGSYRLSVSPNGNVGIGTASPLTPLHVIGDETLSGNINFGSTTRQMLKMFGTGFGIGVQTADLYFRSGAGFAWHVGGVHNDATYNSGGGTTPMTLDLEGLKFGARLGQHLWLWSDPSTTRYFGIGIQDSTIYNRCGGGGADGFAWFKGGIHSNNYHDGGGGQVLMTLDSNGLFVGGPASVCSLTIRGGCDLAEPFPMKEEQIKKGSVVVIDEDHPGQLKLSTEAYDTHVAGVISGAEGISAGIAMHQEGALEGGQNVALSGRVYVQADASFGAIKPGDLLTTSNTPGHAMKVSDRAKAQGAILGKAMSALNESKGVVLVLVTLQ